MIWKGHDYRQARRHHQVSLGINLTDLNCEAKVDQLIAENTLNLRRSMETVNIDTSHRTRRIGNAVAQKTLLDGQFL